MLIGVYQWLIILIQVETRVQLSFQNGQSCVTINMGHALGSTTQDGGEHLDDSMLTSSKGRQHRVCRVQDRAEAIACKLMFRNPGRFNMAMRR